MTDLLTQGSAQVATSFDEQKTVQTVKWTKVKPMIKNNQENI